MIDRYMKILLTVIAVNLTALVTLLTVDLFVPEVRASWSGEVVPVRIEGDQVVRVHVEGGTLDYRTDRKRYGPTLLVETR